MKAILIRRDGFRKEMDVEEKPPIIHRIGSHSVMFMPGDAEYYKDTDVPIELYRLERTFLNENYEETLIYKEM